MLPLACSEELATFSWEYTNVFFFSSGFFSSDPSGLMSCTSTRWLRVDEQIIVEGKLPVTLLTCILSELALCSEEQGFTFLLTLLC